MNIIIIIIPVYDLPLKCTAFISIKTTLGGRMDKKFLMWSPVASSTHWLTSSTEVSGEGVDLNSWRDRSKKSFFRSKPIQIQEDKLQ